MATSAPDLLDVRPLPPRRKWISIVATVEQLEAGESFVLVDDGDLKLLQEHVEAGRPHQTRWEYLEAGPLVWRVRIRRL